MALGVLFCAWQSAAVTRSGCKPRELPHCLAQTRGIQDDCKPPRLSCKDKFVEELRAQGVSLGKKPPTSECYLRSHRALLAVCKGRHSLWGVGTQGDQSFWGTGWSRVVYCRMKRWMVSGGTSLRKGGTGKMDFRSNCRAVQQVPAKRWLWGWRCSGCRAAPYSLAVCDQN